jgi:RNA polymerase sigma-70 factor (ECF subfamily)
MDQSTDGSLVRRVVTVGDTAAYGQLVERYQGHVYGLAFSILGNWVDAQDVAQDAFIRAYVNLASLDNPDKFASWLRRVAFSTCMDFVRQHRPGLFQQMGSPADVDQLQVADAGPPPPELLQQAEAADAVLRAVAALPAKYRIPLTMFHLNGLSYQKVAEFLDVPLGTAKSLIHHAKQLLKPALAAYAPEVGQMIEEVFREHKLRPSFNDRVEQMIKASAHGDLPTIRALAGEDAELVNAAVPTWHNGSALGKAVTGNHVQAVQTLLELGADPTARDGP